MSQTENTEKRLPVYKHEQTKHNLRITIKALDVVNRLLF